MPYVCGPAEYLKAPYGIIICCINRTVEALSILCGFLILIEIWITLKNADAPDKPEAAQVMYVSPDQPVMPHTAYTQQAPYVQPTQYYPPQPQYPYPGMIQQQPTMAQYSGTPKYETQENMYQDYQRQSQAFYQPQQQQQQPQYYQSQQQQQQQQQQSPYASQGYGTPQVPGSMVTAAPQPGASPIIPYPSPGHSVAVSPVLPVGGYSSPHSPVTSAK
ncbi:hypothetical protein BGX26_012616 [Mortierella sp. AD094]|nr:hypothetical protein BGX26_012616 [Mortierella sp. AD094]